MGKASPHSPPWLKHESKLGLLSDPLGKVEPHDAVPGHRHVARREDEPLQPRLGHARQRARLNRPRLGVVGELQGMQAGS